MLAHVSQPCLKVDLLKVVPLGKMLRNNGYLMHKECNPKERLLMLKFRNLYEN